MYIKEPDPAVDLDIFVKVKLYPLIDVNAESYKNDYCFNYVFEA
jgi:hypothetical protein